jgi:hypothetical protein
VKRPAAMRPWWQVVIHHILRCLFLLTVARKLGADPYSRPTIGLLLYQGESDGR